MRIMCWEHNSAAKQEWRIRHHLNETEMFAKDGA